MLRRTFLAIVVVFQLIFGTLHAQTTRIQLEPASSMPPLIDDRPTLTEWLATVQGTGLIEGRLEFIVIANSQLLGNVLTDELVFSGIDQKIRVMFPPFNWPGYAEEVLVNIRLHTKQGMAILPQQRMRTSIARAQKCPLLLGETKQRPRTALGRDKLADRLRFESLLPEEFKEYAITVMSHLAADEFPQEPLAFCQYEVVVIAGDVFAVLRPAQLEALHKWVKAGGSLYLEPTGILEAGHVDLLNKLVADDPRKLIFSMDAKGRLPMELVFGQEPVIHARCGLGRVALHRDQNSFPSEDDAAWRMTAAMLWKFRPQFRDMVQSGRLSDATLQDIARAADNQAFGGGYAPPSGQPGMPYAQAGPPVSEMIDLLRPQGVRMVPLWVIGMLLGSLVLMIGPVDYFTLSWLKRRKWTWITFPAMIVAMTVLTVAITNSYLSTAESRRAFVIHDVGQEGDILRTNRFELVFPASSRRVANDVQAALFTPVMTGGYHDPRYPYQQNPYARNQNAYNGLMFFSEPATVHGRVPARYKVFQDVRQWTPQLNRRFAIAPPAEDAKIDWNSLQVPPYANSAALRSGGDQELMAYVAKVQRLFGPQAQACALTAEGFHRFHYGGRPEWNILQRLSLGEKPGILGLTTHTSPHGGRTLEDLSLTKCCNAENWWLVILVPQGDDIVVYRKSYSYSQ
jgi:hypothetical protein